MKSPALIQQKQEIDDLFMQIHGFAGDPYYQSLMTYYLCIRVSGFVENCVRIIFTEYSIPRAQDHVRTYVEATLGKFPNPTFDNICSLTKKFDAHWNASFKSAVDQQQRQSLDSINNNRNSIAHGGNSTITLNQLGNYYNDVLALLDGLERTCV